MSCARIRQRRLCLLTRLGASFGKTRTTEWKAFPTPTRSFADCPCLFSLCFCAGANGSPYALRQGEAAIAVHHVQTLLKAGLAGAQLGVITPYNGQVEAIRSRLRDMPLAREVEVLSVDGFQVSNLAGGCAGGWASTPRSGGRCRATFGNRGGRRKLLSSPPSAAMRTRWWGSCRIFAG